MKLWCALYIFPQEKHVKQDLFGKIYNDRPQQKNYENPRILSRTSYSFSKRLGYISEQQAQTASSVMQGKVCPYGLRYDIMIKHGEHYHISCFTGEVLFPSNFSSTYLQNDKKN